MKCVYCDQEKYTQVWKETGEDVCYDCRQDLLDTEFDKYLNEKTYNIENYGKEVGEIIVKTFRRDN